LISNGSVDMRAAEDAQMAAALSVIPYPARPGMSPAIDVPLVSFTVGPGQRGQYPERHLIGRDHRTRTHHP
jgi:hypothetical protein